MWNLILVLVSSSSLMVSGQNTIPDCKTPPRISPDACCHTVTVFFPEDVIIECEPKDNISDPLNPPCEIFACLMKKKNLLINNRVDQTAVKTFVIPHYEIFGKATLDNALTKCFAELDGKDNCEAKTFIHCMRRRLSENCPESIWMYGKECTATKLYMQKCPTRA